MLWFEDGVPGGFWAGDDFVEGLLKARPGDLDQGGPFAPSGTSRAFPFSGGFGGLNVSRGSILP